MDIKIKAKLRAYTRGLLPTKISDLENDLDFIPDAPDDGSIYGRQDKEWVNIDQALAKTILELKENSGLNLSYDPNTSTYTLSIRKEDITQLELPNILEPDTTYFVEDLTANIFDDGGTAFSQGNNDYITISEFKSEMDGGNATSIANIIMNPLNSEGVYNG